MVPLAAAIAKDSGLDRGFGLVLGAAHAPLALELARQTGLLMHVAEADPEKAQQARETLAAAGVRPEMKFHIIRGDLVVADVLILETWPDKAVGSVIPLQQGMEPRAGDRVATNL